MKPAHFSLFSGIGGLDIAAEMAGFQTVGQCELADYPTKILEKHWPDVPRWRDIRTITKEASPCQPFSGLESKGAKGMNVTYFDIDGETI